MSEKEEIKLVKVKYICFYCTPPFEFEKEIKINEKGIVKGQVTKCPQCTNLLKLRGFV